MLVILDRGFVSFKLGNRSYAMGRANLNALDTFNPDSHSNESIGLLRLEFEMRKVLSLMNTTVIGHPRSHLRVPAEPVMSLKKLVTATGKENQTPQATIFAFPTQYPILGSCLDHCMFPATS